MDLQALKAFVSITQTGSFSAAAQRLHLSQPAISKRIAGLEQTLEQPLFDRIGKQVQLTEAGALLLPQAQAILDAVAHTERTVRNLRGKVSGVLRMGTSHHIGMHRLPPILRQYAKTYPEVTLALEFLGSEAACRRVERGELEFALATLPPVLDAPLLLEAVWKDRLVVCATMEFADSAAAGSDPLPQLAQSRALLPKPDTTTRQIIEEALVAHGITLRHVMETNNLETIKKMVEIGLGWSVLPESMLDAIVQPLADCPITPVRQLGIVRHRKRSLSNAAQAMLHLIRLQTAEFQPRYPVASTRRREPHGFSK